LEIPHLGKRISDLGESVSEMENRISDLGETISDPGKSVSEIGNRISDLGGTISEIGERVFEIGNRISEMFCALHERFFSLLSGICPRLFGFPLPLRILRFVRIIPENRLRQRKFRELISEMTGS
jgi:hypothetical protein